MKRVLALSLSLSALLLAACSKVPAGNVGVKFQMYGDDKGALKELPPGRYWVGWGYEMYTFPTYTQTYTFTRSTLEGRAVDESISFQTAQGLTVNADVGITYHIDPSKVTLIFQKYRKGIDEITDVYLRNMIRDALVKESASLGDVRVLPQRFALQFMSGARSRCAARPRSKSSGIRARCAALWSIPCVPSEVVPSDAPRAFGLIPTRCCGRFRPFSLGYFRREASPVGSLGPAREK